MKMDKDTYQKVMDLSTKKMLSKITRPVFLHQNVRHISRWTAQNFISLQNKYVIS